MEKETQPLVSVVIPAWNAEKTLGRCLDSICSQTVQNIEIWVVDDGSTDGTWDILQQYAARDARIHPLHQEDKGVA